MRKEMKDSGIPWIGEIPSHWDTCFIKQVMRNKSVKGYPDEQVLSLYRDYGVVPKDSRDDNHNVTSEDTSGYKLVDVGDFVINKMKAWQGSMAVSGYRGIISPAYYICRFTAPVYKKYIHYLLRNETYKAEYLRLSTGLRVGQWDLNVDDFLHIPMVLPPISEQQTIADFLDKKCGEIDEMVSLQEKIVEELKAYKQSVITEAVCKGLNPDVPMKDSGIEWIGQIPENSILSKIGWIIRDYKAGPFGSSLITGNLLTQGEILVYTPEHIAKRETNIEGNLFLPPERLKEMEQFVVHKGEIVFPIVGSLGRAMVITEGLPLGIINQRLSKFALKNGKIDETYFMWVFGKSSFYSTYIDLHCRGAIIVNLTKQIVCDMPIVLHPLEVQKAIGLFLNERCAEIDALISLKQSKIDALKEYKKSIIYEYITGKKEVPYGE